MLRCALFSPSGLPVEWAIYSAAVFRIFKKNDGPVGDQLSQNVPA